MIYSYVCCTPEVQYELLAYTERFKGSDLRVRVAHEQFQVTKLRRRWAHLVPNAGHWEGALRGSIVLLSVGWISCRLVCIIIPVLIDVHLGIGGLRSTSKTSSARLRRSRILIGTHLPILWDSFGILGVCCRARECARECGGHSGQKLWTERPEWRCRGRAESTRLCYRLHVSRTHTSAAARLFRRCNPNPTVEPNVL